VNPAPRIKSSSVTWQQVDSEVVVLDLARSSYLALDDSAAVLWNRLAESAGDPVPAEALTTLLASRYGIATDQARADVTAGRRRCARTGCTSFST
jgi:hypothetical protein